MVIIELPDAQAAALTAKAAQEGLSLEQWLAKLAASAPPPPYRLDDLMARCDLSAPLSDEDLSWLRTPPAGREA